MRTIGHAYEFGKFLFYRLICYLIIRTSRAVIYARFHSHIISADVIYFIQIIYICTYVVNLIWNCSLCFWGHPNLQLFIVFHFQKVLAIRESSEFLHNHQQTIALLLTVPHPRIYTRSSHCKRNLVKSGIFDDRFLCAGA